MPIESRRPCFCDPDADALLWLPSTDLVPRSGVTARRTRNRCRRHDDPSFSGLPEREPAAARHVGSARLATIDRVVQRGVDAGGYPGASVVVGRKGYSVLSRGFGALDWTRPDPGLGRKRASTIWRRLRRSWRRPRPSWCCTISGQVSSLDAPVSRYLPDFSGGLRDQVTVRHLLTHRVPVSRPDVNSGVSRRLAGRSA